MKPFNLEAFKAGQKAIHVNSFSKDTVSFLTVSSKGLIVFEYDSGVVSNSTLKTMEDYYVMVSRHQRLIESYDPEDTWQFYKQTTYYGTDWETCTGTPEWNEDEQYRIHPHNDLIKAQRNGAIIEKWVEAHRPCWFTCYGEPDWDEEATYRVMPKEEKTAAFMRGYNNTLKILNKRRDCRTKGKTKTKTVYEWMWKNTEGYWLMADILSTEEEAANYYAAYEHKKTGRSWEVEV